MIFLERAQETKRPGRTGYDLELPVGAHPLGLVLKAGCREGLSPFVMGMKLIGGQSSRIHRNFLSNSKLRVQNCLSDSF